jgi:tetratricopeptide (TPR) repeat protein
MTSEESDRRELLARCRLDYGADWGGARDFHEAIEACEEALAFSAQEAAPWYYKGIACQGLGRGEDALDAYRRAAAIDPSVGGLPFNMGGLLVSLGRFDEALSVYDTALARASEEHRLWSLKADALIRLGRRGAAIDALGRAKALCPTFADAWVLWSMGEHHAGGTFSLGAFPRERRDRVVAALGMCERALSVLDADQALWTAKADAHYLLGEDVPAIASYDRALSAADGGRPRLLRGKGAALLQLRRWREALRCLRASRRLDPTQPWIDTALSVALHQVSMSRQRLVGYGLAASGVVLGALGPWRGLFAGGGTANALGATVAAFLSGIGLLLAREAAVTRRDSSLSLYLALTDLRERLISGERPVRIAFW